MCGTSTEAAVVKELMAPATAKKQCTNPIASPFLAKG
jgi:hypothetical protein